MRKPLTTRIIGLTALYCAVFFFLVIAQFSNKGNFSLSAGEMTIRGRYLTQQSGIQTAGFGSPIAGGIRIFYEGLEFNLREEREKGLAITEADAVSWVNPNSMLLTETSAQFFLPDGSAVTFLALKSNRGAELQISAELTDNISEITIPITPRRSSLVRDNEQIGVSFGGSRYFFNTAGKELESGRIVLSSDNSSVAYRARGQQKEFNPSDFILEQAQDYESVIQNWRNTSYSYWNQNIISLVNEDDITAYLEESLQRGSGYAAAVSAASAHLLNTPRHSHKSALFIGGMANAYTTFIAAEDEKLNLISRLTSERSLAVFKEEHVLDYLYSRGSMNLANDIIGLINDADAQSINIDYCAGLLEAFEDLMNRRLPNSVDPLIEQILLVISENLHRDSEHDTVSASEGKHPEYNFRLGKALVFWADNSQDTSADEKTLSDWSAIGKSLVFSGLSGSTSGKYHNMLKLTDYYPRVELLTDSGLWAWTIAPSIRAAITDSNTTFSFTFPLNMTHYVILRGIRPFLRIQIHGQDWRSDSQFERYEVSGWVYYQQEQVLILKLRHRAATENVRLIYREAPRAPTPAPVSTPAPRPAPAGESVD